MKKAFTITGALSAAAATAIATYLTPFAVLWVAIVLGLGLFSIFLSWGTTEAYKKLYVIPPEGLLYKDEPMRQKTYWKTFEGKTRIFRFAIRSGFLFNCISGVVFTLVTSTATSYGRQWILVILILWALYSAFIGVSSPWFYAFSMKKLLPKLNRKLDDGEPPVEEVSDLTVLGYMKGDKDA